MPDLFSEITIRNMTIKNRIIMPPMVCFGYSNNEGQVTEKNFRHYADRARGGAGLIIIEATAVSREGRLSDVQLGLWSDDQIGGFTRIAKACHDCGARVLMQIHHAGLATPPSVSNDRLAPSDFTGLSNNGGRQLSAREMRPEEIDQVQADFLASAVRAQKAGMDGVELHGAHGYLISQFLSPLVNKRHDEYGGNFTKRTTFVRQLVRKIRLATGPDFIIGCRMGCDEPTLETSVKIARSLEKAGVDLVHVSIGMSSLLKIPGAIKPPVPTDFPYNWVVYGGTEIKKKIGVPVIVVNGIRTPEQAIYLVGNNLADFAAVGKGILVNPDWANEAREHKNVSTCLDCKECAFFRPGTKCPGQTAIERS